MRSGYGTSLTIEVTANVTTAATFTNSATVVSITSPDPNTANNTATNLTAAVPPSNRPTLGISAENNLVVLRWTGAFTLQCAPTVTGVYTNVPGATSPFSVNPALSPRAFYRLLVP